ncbi:deoxyribose-phosphate aldolase [Muricauda sp. 334s03]|uniref:Deoxyribose-phosphate aldolase n=1 Tax=Flagellimonas yonaguniensis TaxID=3031325 RepID=A0ABT5XW49_9FLAO|nr:deoxyribose-phosphate aldolase [[Muricauda] yonaguniensis]MDF0715406.1 deoxyribose-phosphate aldolase [[Muricauda] yonaguniensis]
MLLEKYIDHTNLKPTATGSDIKKLCEEAKIHGFYAICVNGCHVSLAKESLDKTDIKIAAVIGFPLGAMSSKAKVFEAVDCIGNGADEIDMVINLGWLKSGMYNAVRDEIKAIKEAIGNKILKVIIETCYLTDEEKEKACNLAVAAHADYVKTSTGFGTEGATFEDVKLMKRTVGENAKIKASGGVKDKKTALHYIELGVSRIGTSSGPSLIK